MAEFCNVINEIAVIREHAGYRKALRFISWNGADPKLDLREWDPQGNATKRGFTLSDEEAKKLYKALDVYVKSLETVAEFTDNNEELPF